MAWYDSCFRNRVVQFSILYVVETVLTILTYCVHKNVPNLLVDVPVFDPVPKTVEKPFMEVVNLRDLIEDVLDKTRISNTSCLGPLQRLQVNLKMSYNIMM